MSRFNEKEAKAYLSRRLKLEIKAQDALKRKIRETFRKLCLLGMPLAIDAKLFTFDNPAIKKKVDRILRQLKAYIALLLKDYCEKAIANSVKRNEIEAKVNVEQYLKAKVINDRVNNYIEQVRHESQVWISAGKSMSLTSQALMDAWDKERYKPYDNAVFKKAKKTFPWLKALILSYGVGKYLSGEKALYRLARGVIGLIMRDNDYESYKDMGVSGYMVYRGSSYPCAECDDMVGFHSLDDIDDLPPYHAHCVCFYVPVEV